MLARLAANGRGELSMIKYHKQSHSKVTLNHGLALHEQGSDSPVLI